MLIRASLLAAAVLLAGCSSSPEQPQDDSTVIDTSVDVGSNGLSVEWRTRVGQGVGSHYTRIAPAVVDDKLYIASRDGRIAQLELASGDTDWSITLDDDIGAGVAVQGQYLIVATRNGVLHCLDRNNGEEIWQAPLSSEAVSPAGFDSSKAYVHTIDGRISAFDLATGAQRWSYETAMPILSVRGTASPVVVGGVVVTGLANGKVVAIDARLGVPSWEKRLATPEGRSELERLVDSDGTVQVDNQLIYAASYHGKMAALSASGETRWEQDASSYTSPAMALGNLYLTLDDSSVQAFDVYSGNPVWTQKSLQGKQLGAVEAWDGKLAVVDSDGYIYLLSQIDGEITSRLSLVPNALHVSYPNQSEATRWRRLRGQHFGAYSPLKATAEGLLVYTNNGDIMLLTQDDTDS